MSPQPVDGSRAPHRPPSPRLALAVVLGSPVALQPPEIAQQSRQMAHRTCHAAQTRAAPRAPKYPALPAAPARPTPPTTSPARDPSPQRAAPPAPLPATPSTLRAATSATAACPNKRAPPPSSASRQGSALRSCPTGSAAARSPAPRRPPRSANQACGTPPRASAPDFPQISPPATVFRPSVTFPQRVSS